MKKFTSFMLMLLCAVTTWAGVTDLPEMSTDGNIKWYTIKNTRSANGGYLYYTANGVKDTNTRTAASFFYFTGTSVACKIHNYTTDLLFTGAGAWNAEGVNCALTVSPLNTGVMIGFNSTFLNEQNYADGYTTWGDVNDEGSIFVIEPVTDFSAIIDVPAAKTAAIEEINNLATQSHIYPAATDYVASINEVEAASTGLADLNAAVEAVNAIVASYKATAYAALNGKYYSIYTPNRNNGRYLEMASSKVIGAASLTTPADIWQFVANNDKVYIFNPYTGKYLCEPGNSSSEIAVTDNVAEAGAYELTVNNTNPESQDAKIKLTSNSKSVHVDGSNNLVRWDNGGASEYTIAEMTATDITAIANAYKTTLISTLEQWATLSVVFDATLIENAKAAINANSTTTYAAFAELDAELTKVTDAVAAKMFTFQTLATDSHRENVWVSANATTGKAIGLHGDHNYNSIWSLRHAGGVSFYMYNELNEKYMGAPSGNCALTDAPVAAYTFEIIDAVNGVVEMKCNGETMHASNHTDDKLLNWDGDEAASRWYIRTINIAADIDAILADLTEADYAEVPELGQYSKAAYDALVEARTSARTVEEVEHAIAAFNKAKNVPVYFITSAWDDDYSKGSAILYNGTAWRWATADKYNKQMWMTIPAYTKEDVPTVEAYSNDNTSYEICDYLTGTVMRGKSVQIVAINGWEGAYNLQYNADATSTDAAHHAQSGGALVNWKPATASDCKASAWRVEYVGNSYDLDQLTDEKITALGALNAAYNAKAFYADAEMGEGLGQYTGDKDAIVAALNSAAAILNGTLAQQATAEVETIDAAKTALNSAAALAINAPKTGRYYRIQGASNTAPTGYNGYYITGHTNADGGRIALTSEDDASTIYYFDGTNLIAYQSGLVIALNSGHWTFASIDDNSKPASTITFAGSPRTAGAYTIKSADRYFHYFYYSENNTVQVNRCQNDVCAEHDWYLTEVTTLPVAITAAGYATFYAPVEVSFDDVEAYYTTGATVENYDAYLKMDTIKNNVIPAREGAILKGNEGEYDFTINYERTATNFENNALTGTVAKTLVAKEDGAAYYVLAISNGTVGLYNPIKGEDTTTFYNAGHKAYMVVAGAAQTAGYSFSFDWNGTTGIESVEGAAEATNAVIYDITGRQIKAIVTPGIYIINGKKTFVK